MMLVIDNWINNYKQVYVKYNKHLEKINKIRKSIMILQGYTILNSYIIHILYGYIYYGSWSMLHCNILISYCINTSYDIIWYFSLISHIYNIFNKLNKLLIIYFFFLISDNITWSFVHFMEDIFSLIRRIHIRIF